MKFTLLVFCILISANAYSQRDEAQIDSILSDYVIKLKARGAKNVFSMKRYCDGNVQMFTMPNKKLCSSNGTYIEAFLFFSESEQSKVVKIDNCGLFNEQIMEQSQAMDYYVANKSQVNSSVIKPFETASANETPRARTTVYRCHRGFSFYNELGQNTITYSMYQLSNEGDQPNVNFNHNRQQPLVLLENQLKGELLVVERKGGFVRIQ